MSRAKARAEPRGTQDAREQDRRSDVHSPFEPDELLFADDESPEQPNPSLNLAARTGRPTEDEQLLESPAQRAPVDPAGFTHTDPWRVLRIQGEFVAGFDALANLGPAVTIF